MYSADNCQREMYRVGIYCRLSNEDGEAGESNSIANQKAILHQYVLKRGWTVADIYIDDGYSGLNFDRPGFKRMLKDIENRRISIVISKDMSRLGRDYIQVGYYIEKYFPENNIRYIALNDNIDTGRDEGSNDIAPFKAIINDMYSKDISKKVRSVFNHKQKEGKFIGSFAPYGYSKNPDDNNALIIDEEAAGIVKLIFRLYLDGSGYSQIAHYLNDESVITPSLYKSYKYKSYKNSKERVQKWDYGSVRAILSNPVYAGMMAQHKYQRINYKSKKVRPLDKSQWIVVKGTHEPIISEQEYNLAQGLMKSNNDNFTYARKNARRFSGLVFCGDCGEYMTYFRTTSGYDYLICSAYKRYGKKQCSRHSILESRLVELILQDLRGVLEKYADKDMLKQEAEKLTAGKGDSDKFIRSEIKIIMKRLDEIERTVMSLYEDKVRGVISEQQFIHMNNNYYQEKEIKLHKLRELESKQNLLKDQMEERERAVNLLNKVLQISKLDRLILSHMIEKIEIFENEEITIYYSFSIR